MNRSVLIPAAWVIDQVAGDPEWFPHPVRMIGLATTLGEAALRPRRQSSFFELLAGGTLTLAIVGASYCATRHVVQSANRTSTGLGIAVEVLLGWTCLAGRNLQQEALLVTRALEVDDLPRARRQLARIVGRDTEHLDTAEICRALIETLAESASDGILAPIFYMAIGGAPLAMAYKAVNTLDSMIGHADTQYFYFGKAAARLDDAANFLPSRLTAACIIATSALGRSADARAAWRIWRLDGAKHKSPNAGQPESAMSGALHVQLGGDNTYAGEVVSMPRIGQEFPAASLAQAKTAIRLVSLVTIAGVAAATGLLLWSQRRQRKLPT
ncbi:Adenosylcobinamide-phosphate synthase [Acidisarcina polymorpha]|uniref:Cobalamin biosynthesis protein CobD n=1 Tax=Acidisarcina polymorpha TaxID=2211140 RepID=A0A2Z5G611_9BACT|nr:adenosylcobinamide-phosphate synthase CbiB [Acidisarcina polymorpha]AXC14399.1 Adenosylcobinamide-phosphate synthase [Acidisarcina polymorpha]